MRPLTTTRSTSEIRRLFDELSSHDDASEAPPAVDEPDLPPADAWVPESLRPEELVALLVLGRERPEVVQRLGPLQTLVSNREALLFPEEVPSLPLLLRQRPGGPIGPGLATRLAQDVPGGGLGAQLKAQYTLALHALCDAWALRPRDHRALSADYERALQAPVPLLRLTDAATLRERRAAQVFSEITAGAFFGWLAAHPEKAPFREGRGPLAQVTHAMADQLANEIFIFVTQVYRVPKHAEAVREDLRLHLVHGWLEARGP